MLLLGAVVVELMPLSFYETYLGDHLIFHSPVLAILDLSAMWLSMFILYKIYHRKKSAAWLWIYSMCAANSGALLIAIAKLRRVL